MCVGVCVEDVGVEMCVFECGVWCVGVEYVRMRMRMCANDAKASERAASDAVWIEW